MAPKKVKYVTLKISSDKLVNFPDLTSHVQIKPTKQQRSKSNKVTKLKIKGSSLSVESISREQSLKPNDLDFNSSASNSIVTSNSNSMIGLSNQNNNNGSNNNNNTSNNINFNSKLSSSVRVGISGLTMNTSIIRELDTTGHVSRWAKFETESIENKITKKTETILEEKIDNKNGNSTEINITNNNKQNEDEKKDNTPLPTDTKLPNIEQLDTNHGVISMKDYRGFKGLEVKDQQNQLIKQTESKGRKVVRSFSGYLMLWPSWHKIKEGDIKKKFETEERSHSNMNSNVKPEKKVNVKESSSETPKPEVRSINSSKNSNSNNNSETLSSNNFPVITSMSDIIEAAAGNSSNSISKK